jgi:hypothetical protein
MASREASTLRDLAWNEPQALRSNQRLQAFNRSEILLAGSRHYISLQCVFEATCFRNAIARHSMKDTT